MRHDIKFDEKGIVTLNIMHIPMHEIGFIWCPDNRIYTILASVSEQPEISA